jgi:hypothetical protein
VAPLSVAVALADRLLARSARTVNGVSLLADGAHNASFKDTKSRAARLPQDSSKADTNAPSTGPAQDGQPHGATELAVSATE